MLGVTQQRINAIIQQQCIQLEIPSEIAEQACILAQDLYERVGSIPTSVYSGIAFAKSYRSGHLPDDARRPLQGGI